MLKMQTFEFKIMAFHQVSIEPNILRNGLKT